MLRIFAIGIFSLISVQIVAQGLVHHDGYIVTQPGSHIIVKGSNGNYSAKNDAKIKMQPNSNIKIDGSWQNDANTGVFTTNEGKIEMTTSNGEIKGRTTTNFPDLTLSGNGVISLVVPTLVGGGHNGGGLGRLRLNDTKLKLQGRTLIINNEQSNALNYTSNGGIISESNSSLGYGRIQWNIRTGNGGPVYVFPFLTENNNQILSLVTVNTPGSNSIDSGFVSLSTYPTVDQPVPNNRPLPLGVFHTDNECEGENSKRFINRYWIIEQDGYTTMPDVSLDFQYSTADHSGSNDAIDENHLGLLRWDASQSKWDYPLRGDLDPTNNRISYRARKNFEGIWTLSDTTPFPKAQFSVLGDCQKDSIIFTDESNQTTDKIIQWLWDFGDNRYSSKQSPVHFYQTYGTMDVKFTIRSQAGCLDSAEKRILVNAAPVANYLIFDTCENATVQLESKSWPGAGFITSENWDFGMGGSSVQGKTASYYYGAVGLPDIRLIVYNSKGCKDTMLRNVYIAPKPYAYVDYQNDCQYTPIFFDNGATAGGGTIISYQWDFGNGVRSSNPTETVAFPEFGTFPIEFIVENSYGCKDTSSTNLEVYPRAIAKFDYSPQQPRMLENVKFVNQSEYDEIWDWDFGDTYYSTLESPTHQFPTHDLYRVRLIANTQYGCDDTTFKDITVKSIPLYWFANAFSPGNSEGRNDDFGLVTPLRITDYKISIYNRWGQLVFTTTDLNKKWDGKFNGEYCPAGQYIYYSTFKSPENDIQVYEGSIMLLR